MKIKHIIVTLLTLCLLLSIAACDQADDPPANDTTAEIITEAPTESPTETPTEEPTAPATYPVTVRVEGTGTVTFNGDTVEETLSKELTTADAISLTATPAEGYVFKGWFEEANGELTLLHDEGEVTFTVPARETILVAVFEKAYLLDVFTPEPEMGFFTVDGEELTEEEQQEVNDILARKDEINAELLKIQEEYKTAMESSRNAGMLEVAKQYLESGDVVFFAVGLAHLLNNVNGLVDTLRDAGYTVELVTYS